jgi:hypothetical protein
MTPKVGQFYKNRYHSKVIKVLEVHADLEPPTVLAELQVQGGSGHQWQVQFLTLRQTYKLLEGHENTADHLLTMPGMGGKLNIP